MRDKIDAIDARIVHFRWLATTIADQRAFEAIEAIIQDLEADKAALQLAAGDQAVK